MKAWEDVARFAEAGMNDEALLLETEVRRRIALAEQEIRDDERSAICDDMARWSRDNTNVGRPTRAAWFLQVADRIRNRRD